MKIKARRKYRKRQTRVDGTDDQVVDDDDDTTTRPLAAALPLLPPVGASLTPAHPISSWTSVVKKNGFNLVRKEKFCITFDCVGFGVCVVRQEDKDGEELSAVYCASMRSLQPFFASMFFFFFVFVFC